jgi:hypothetical protein
MIDHLHPAITTLLLTRGNLRANEVDVRFELPAKAWVDSLAYPTINLFLFDLAEKSEMRNAGATVTRGNGRATTRLPPRRVDLHYLVCAFSSVIEDEHALLWRTMATLLKYPTLPHELLPEKVREMDIAIQTRVGRAESDPRALELWGALDLPPRPALFYSVIAPMDLDVEIEAPLVLTRITRFTRPTAADQRADRGIDVEHITRRGGAFDGFAPHNGLDANERALSVNLAEDYTTEKSLDLIERLLRGEEPQERDHARYRIAGIVQDAAGNSLKNVTVGVVARAIECVTTAAGRFTLANVPAGLAKLWFKRTDKLKLLDQEKPLDPDVIRQQEQALPLHVIDVDIPWAFDIDADHVRALYHMGGVIRDRQGQPLNKVKISVPANAASCKTDARGRFFLQLPTGSATLLFKRRGKVLNAQLQIDVPVVFDILLFDETYRRSGHVRYRAVRRNSIRYGAIRRR